MNTTAGNRNSAAQTQGHATAEPVKFVRRVGSTTVEVVVHFSKSHRETMADIVGRLLEREVDKVA